MTRSRADNYFYGWPPSSDCLRKIAAAVNDHQNDEMYSDDGGAHAMMSAEYIEFMADEFDDMARRAEQAESRLAALEAEKEGE